MISGNYNIEIGFDNVSQDYYIIWQPPLVVSSGSNKIYALRDLQKVAHFGVDSIISQKMKEITKED